MQSERAAAGLHICWSLQDRTAIRTAWCRFKVILLSDRQEEAQLSDPAAGRWVKRGTELCFLSPFSLHAVPVQALDSAGLWKRAGFRAWTSVFGDWVIFLVVFLVVCWWLRTEKLRIAPVELTEFTWAQVVDVYGLKWSSAIWSSGFCSHDLSLLIDHTHSHIFNHFKSHVDHHTAEMSCEVWDVWEGEPIDRSLIDRNQLIWPTSVFKN